ncbi:MAG: acyl-CoA dehydrogenase C-terminal domain-containing protein, partial [Gammaproteobacteria bacterium]
AARDGAEIGAAAHDFLNHAAYTILGWCLWRTLAALPAAGDSAWLEGKRGAARFFFERLVPRAAAHAAAVRAGAGGLMEAASEALLA